MIKCETYIPKKGNNLILKLDKFFNKFANFVGYLCAIATFLMMLNVFYDVVMRYFFKTGSIAMQELEWHFFAFIILFGLIYTLKEDSHVRVDIFYDKFSNKKKAIINIIGVFVLMLPIVLLISFDSIDYALESFTSHEGSGDPGGLPNRWIVKSMIPISFFLLSFYSIGFIIKNIKLYLGYDAPILTADHSTKLT